MGIIITSPSQDCWENCALLGITPAHCKYFIITIWDVSEFLQQRKNEHWFAARNEITLIPTDLGKGLIKKQEKDTKFYWHQLKRMSYSSPILKVINALETPIIAHGASLVAQLAKNPPVVRETWVWSLGWEDPLEIYPRKSYPLQYSSLENIMDYTVYGVTKSRTRLGDFHFHFSS